MVNMKAAWDGAVLLHSSSLNSAIRGSCSGARTHSLGLPGTPDAAPHAASPEKHLGDFVRRRTWSPKNPV
eukprot:scaffold132016_cov22-Tisochrysis_lutea.AAC.1